MVLQVCKFALEIDLSIFNCSVKPLLILIFFTMKKNIPSITSYRNSNISVLGKKGGIHVQTYMDDHYHLSLGGLHVLSTLVVSLTTITATA